MHPVHTGAGQHSSVVAQDCILLYRGFPIRRPSANPGGVENPAPSRLEIGDTADLEIGATKNFVLHPMNTDMHTFKRIVINKPMHPSQRPGKN
jgi:hypothetical protein